MIELFPERMLDGSIHTAILVGVVLLWMMTETFGFVFAGFVVTGYLAAIGIVAPMSLVALFVEAILTYGIVWTLAIGPSKLDLWSRVFGRERFLLFVVVSVPVRLVVEGLAAPGFEWILQPLFHDPVWRGSRFFGIGIVLVPLLANTFWKPGMVRGLFQVLLGSAATYAVLRYVLMPLTNFQLGGFELIFERVAVDFLATPKAYIILVTTAFVAAHNNLRFGWDFGGILVPALLAIVTLTPLKLIVTFAEVIALVFLYRGLIRLPWVRDLNLEGPRRIVSVYVVSYAMKWVIAVLALRWAPDMPISDAYGFGYLLTALIAVRCMSKKNTARTLITLLVTVIQGLFASLALSLALTWLMPPAPLTGGAPIEERLEEPIARSVLLAHASVRPEYPPEQTAETAYLDWIVGLERLTRADDATDFPTALASFRAQGLDARWAVRADGERCLSIRAPRTGPELPVGLPALWWCGGAGPGLYVPSPLGDPDSLWAAAWLAERGLVSFVIVNGIDDARTALLGARDPRQLRRWGRLRDALGPRTVLLVRTQPDGESWLDPRSALTAPALATRPGDGPNTLAELPVRFEADHGSEQPLWELMRRQDGLLTLTLPDLAAQMPQPPAPVPLQRALDAAILHSEARRIDPSTPAHRLTAAEVLIGAAARMAREGHDAAGPLAWIADRLGARLATADDEAGRRLWLLEETEQAPLGFGAWVFRPGAPGPWFVAAPLSTDERGTAEVAALLWRRVDGEALWVSNHGTRFGLQNMLDGDLRRLPFAPLAARQVLRPYPPAEGIGPAARVLLVRHQVRRGPDTPALVIARGVEAVHADDIAPIERLLGPHFADWPGYGYVLGDPATSALNASGQFPVQYVNAMVENAALVAWFNPALLGEVRGTAQYAQRIAWYREHGVPMERTRVEALAARLDPDAPVRLPTVFPLLRHHVEALDDASIEGLGGGEHGDFVMLDTETRLIAALVGPTWTCTATAGAPMDAFPFTGCWRQR